MGEIRIVGTAHVSKESVAEVRAAIEEFNPTIVAVELDHARYTALKKQVGEASVTEVLESGNFMQLLVQWILAYIQRKIGMDVGVEPGAEMKAAIEEAEQRGMRLGLIDRDIRITLKRFWRSLSLIEKFRMVYALGASVLTVEGESIDIEELKKQDMVASAMEEFRKFSPNGAKALIDERDAYLAKNIIDLSSREERVLAVVGAGHVPGIKKYLADPALLPPVESLVADIRGIPWGRVFEIVVTVSFALLLAAIAFSGIGLETLLAALLFWVLIHGVLTAVFTLAAGGHPFSALAGFAVSWATALHPILAAGWFAAYVEARIRKPSPADFRKIFAAESFTEMWKIPLFRVVIVAALANVGSTIGTVAYFIFVLPVLQIDPQLLITQGFGNMINWVTGLFP
ncbi:MAG: TraB/GumN family protein [Methanoregulaceae archaeon]|nr:TraB/GumN family protein [Methanoregulaceae archaeon]